MKPLLFLLFSAICLTGRAACTEGAFHVWPAQGTIGDSTLFWIEGEGTVEYIIARLDRGCNVVLESPNHRVCLDRVEYNRGAFNTSHVLMRPDQKLRPGETYELKIVGLSGSAVPLFKRFDTQTATWEAFTFTAGPPDTLRTAWVRAPAIKRFLSRNYPEGESRFFVLDPKLGQGMGEFLYCVEKPVGNGRMHRYWMTASAGLLYIGYMPCAGAFHVLEGQLLTVRITAIDRWGNRYVPPTGPALLSFQVEE